MDGAAESESSLAETKEKKLHPGEKGALHSHSSSSMASQGGMVITEEEITEEDTELMLYEVLLALKKEKFRKGAFNEAEIVEKLAVAEEDDASSTDTNSSDESSKLEPGIFEELAKEVMIQSRDGLHLKTFVLRRPNAKKVMLLMLPLGASNMYFYRMILAKFWEEFSFVSFQYRGLFESESPKELRRMSIRDHAEDAMEVLQCHGFDRVEVLLGHSMGVSVALEFMLLFPNVAEKAVLINGAHGSVFDHAFQLVSSLRLPFAQRGTEELVKFVRKNNPRMFVGTVRDILDNRYVAKMLKLLVPYVGRKTMVDLYGKDYVHEIIKTYFDSLAASDKTAKNWVQCFQELDAHSVKHLLHKIDTPTLLLSSQFDYLLPQYGMSEMAKLMPNAEIHNDWLSTHFSIVENPDFILNHMEEFLIKKS